jgi:hypothetical protein
MLQIRSELARQEANISTQNTKFGTAISFVALVFLPATAIAVRLFFYESPQKDGC